MINVQNFFSEMIELAIKDKISDIYMLPSTNFEYHIIFKQNVTNQRFATLSYAEARQLHIYIKYKANMDISDIRRPQSGHITLAKDCFMRVSSVGNYQQNETMVCRLIYAFENIQKSYMFPIQYQHLLTSVKKAGIHIFSGPMGAGKTSTMYSLANELVDFNKMILTIEDPVEIYAPKFLQLQVNPLANMEYLDLIKVGLRHRPDVFIIGEIRDNQTAKAVINAALSGHTVLTTIHARSAKGVITRLIDLGIDEYYLRATLNSIVYQELIPQKNDQLSALQEQLLGDEIWQENASSRWDGMLNDAYQAGKISATTLQTYRKVQ